MFQAYIRRIPRVNLAGAIALGRALIAATDLVPRLSESVLRARRVLETRLDNLTARTWGHESHPRAERSPIALAGRNLDALWMALHDWLEAIAALPAHNEAARSAVEMLVGIFPEGVTLVRPPPLLEWAESEARIARIEKGGLEATLRSLGGEPFVEAIREAHAHYVHTLGNTEGGALSTRAIKHCLDGAVLAIHAYVTCVIAELFDGGDPESTNYACALLGPLDIAQSQWDVRAAFFEQTIEAFPPPPPTALGLEDSRWIEEQFAHAV
jgi:hypothetical protein